MITLEAQKILIGMVYQVSDSTHLRVSEQAKKIFDTLFEDWADSLGCDTKVRPTKRRFADFLIMKRGSIEDPFYLFIVLIAGVILISVGLVISLPILSALLSASQFSGQTAIFSSTLGAVNSILPAFFFGIFLAYFFTLYLASQLNFPPIFLAVGFFVMIFFYMIASVMVSLLGMLMTDPNMVSVLASNYSIYSFLINFGKPLFIIMESVLFIVMWYPKQPTYAYSGF